MEINAKRSQDKLVVGKHSTGTIFFLHFDLESVSLSCRLLRLLKRFEFILSCLYRERKICIPTMEEKFDMEFQIHPVVARMINWWFFLVSLTVWFGIFYYYIRENTEANTLTYRYKVKFSALWLLVLFNFLYLSGFYVYFSFNITPLIRLARGAFSGILGLIVLVYMIEMVVLVWASILLAPIFNIPTGAQELSKRGVILFSRSELARFISTTKLHLVGIFLVITLQLVELGNIFWLHFNKNTRNIQFLGLSLVLLLAWLTSLFFINPFENLWGEED